MFSNLHRPVPSTAALKVLRQLAYVSSGAICGAAALVAEERRRRTRLAEKIVENSRRLKQHPRYAHPAANRTRSAAKDENGNIKPGLYIRLVSPFEHEEPGHEYEQLGHEYEQLGHEHERLRHKHIRRGQTEDMPSSEGRHQRRLHLKAEYLPSAVEECYERVRQQRQGIDQEHDHTKPQQEHGPTRPRQEHGHAASPSDANTSSSTPSMYHKPQKSDSPSAVVVTAAHRRAPGYRESRANQIRSAVETHELLELLKSSTLRAKPPSDVMDLAHESPDLLHLDTKLSDHSVGSLDDTRPYSETTIQQLALDSLNKKDYRTLSWICERHSHHIDLPQESHPAIYSNFASTERLDAATALVANTKQPLCGSVLAACQTPWAKLLIAKWERTRNLTAVSDLFANMTKAAGTGRMDLLVHNAMIQACVKAPHLTLGEHYLREMQLKDRKRSNVTTLGHTMLLAAQLRDWDCVEYLLSTLHDSTQYLYVEETAQKHLVRMFIPVLEEYARHHEAEQVRSFVAIAMEKYRVIPDATTIDIVLASFARHSRIDLALEWLVYLREHGLEAEIDANTVACMLRAHYHETRPYSEVLWQHVQRINEEAPQLLSQQLHVLLEEAIVYDLDCLRPGPDTVSRMRSLRQRLEMVDRMFSEESVRQRLALAKIWSFSNTKTDPDNNKIDIRRTESEARILLEFALGNPSKAVAVYRVSLALGGIPPPKTELDTTKSASLCAQQGDSGEDLTSSADDVGLNLFAGLTPNMIHRLKNSPRLSCICLRQTLLYHYKASHQNGFQIRHHLVSSVARRLVDEGRARWAISILKTIYNSQWAESTIGTTFDMPSMTVFLQAYVVSDSLAGIKWVVHTVLERRLRIDKSFMKTLKRARTHFALASKLPGNEHLRPMLQTVTELFEISKSRQREQIETASMVGSRIVTMVIERTKVPLTL